MGKLIIFTGSGISAESGIATFRGTNQSLWHNHNIDEVCDYLTWQDNYDLVHAFYSHRRAELDKAKPNAAHFAITDWQKRYKTIVITQNVDSLLEQAGCTDVLHLHGLLNEMICEKCGNIWDIGNAEWTIDSCCPNEGCGGRALVKPNVVFFNQAAPKYSDLIRITDDIDPDDVFLVMGTSGKVIAIDHYIYYTPCYKILNNLEPSRSWLSGHIVKGLNGVDCFDKELFMPATEAVVEIDQILKERLG